jgi:hypothetical protein
VATIFRNTFKDKNRTTFIPKEYFDTLNPQQKAKFIRSQYEYQRMYRSILVKGIQNVHLPTKILNNNIHMSIHEWLLNVPDYQHQKLFLQITEVNNNELELRCVETNLHIAKKWARNALTYISRILKPIQLASAFTDTEDIRLNTNVEDWQPPPPPVIEFMPDPRNAWKTDIPKLSTKPTTNKIPDVKT